MASATTATWASQISEPAGVVGNRRECRRAGARQRPAAIPMAICRESANAYREAIWRLVRCFLVSGFPIRRFHDRKTGNLFHQKFSITTREVEGCALPVVDTPLGRTRHFFDGVARVVARAVMHRGWGHARVGLEARCRQGAARSPAQATQQTAFACHCGQIHRSDRATAWATPRQRSAWRPP